MIITAADLTDDLVADVQICIVGSGAAGITLACELDRNHFKVLLLEAGSVKHSKVFQDYYAGSVNAPHPAADDYRRVGFGGTTSLWGGRCVPFDPIDFERREYVAESGWPIAYSDVSRYYPRALEYCDAGKFDFTAAGSIPGAGPTISGLKAGNLVEWDLIERYSLPTNFATRYGRKLRASKNVTVVLEARCVRLVKSAGEDRIQAVEIVHAGARRIIRAATFVLAMGGIETTRLLLCSDPQGAGYGNRYDRLGRFYGCHLESTFGKLVPHGARVAFDFERTAEGVYCRRKFQFTAPAQREHALLNSAFRLHFPAYSDAAHGSSVMSSIYLAKSFLVAEYRDILQHDSAYARFSPTGAHLRNVLLGIPEMSRFGVEWLFRRKLATRKLPYTLVANADGSYPLEFNCEQTPLASSRITLSSDLDAHGVRRVHIDWRRSEEDLIAVRRGFELMRDAFAASSSCRLEFDERTLPERIKGSSPVGGHHIGTARMASSARDGVVDINAALFDFGNVYVASSAIFPTGSHANPTLTIVAMTLRLADRLRTLNA